MLRDVIEKLDYKNSIGLILRTADKTIERAIDAEFREKFGMTGSHWKVIIVLAIHDGISQKALADFISIEGPTLVPIIDKMERDEYLIRKHDPKDRRSNNISLTKKSLDLVEAIVDTIIEFRSMLTTGISKNDIDVTRNVLLQMTQNSDKFLKIKGQNAFPTILKQK